METSIKRRNVVKAKKYPSKTGYKGIRERITRSGEKIFQAYVTLYNKYTDNHIDFTIGNYPTVEEAHNERIKFIAKLF